MPAMGDVPNISEATLTGFMDAQGPEQDIYSSNTPDEVLMIISTRSDYWYNLAKGLPKLYASGFDRNTLEEQINVDASRQNVWSVSAEVFRSLQVLSGSFNMPR